MSTHDAHGHHDHKPGFLLRWLCSTNHKASAHTPASRWSAAWLAASCPEVMRAQLMFNNHVVDSGQEWNVIVTSHGLLMIFFSVMPA